MSASPATPAAPVADVDLPPPPSSGVSGNAPTSQERVEPPSQRTRPGSATVFRARIRRGADAAPARAWPTALPSAPPASVRARGEASILARYLTEVVATLDRALRRQGAGELFAADERGLLVRWTFARDAFDEPRDPHEPREPAEDECLAWQVTTSDARERLTVWVVEQAIARSVLAALGAPDDACSVAPLAEFELAVLESIWLAAMTSGREALPMLEHLLATTGATQPASSLEPGFQASVGLRVAHRATPDAPPVIGRFTMHLHADDFAECVAGAERALARLDDSGDADADAAPPADACARMAPWVTWRLSLGELATTRAELAQLSPGAVVLPDPEQPVPAADHSGGRLLAWLVPSGLDATHAQAATVGWRADATGTQLSLGHARPLHDGRTSGAVPEPPEPDPPTDPDDEEHAMRDAETPAESAPDTRALDRALGAAPVDLSVEIARCRFTAAELDALRAGDVVDLDRTPAAPVALRVGDTVVAWGELVEIEGHLGVRVTELSEASA